jgi:hypothetical protein
MHLPSGDASGFCTFAVNSRIYSVFLVYWQMRRVNLAEMAYFCVELNIFQIPRIVKIGLPILFLLLLTVAEVADAQILVGPVAGSNYSWVSFGDKDLKDEYKIKGKYGYHFGAHCAFRVRKRFFLHSSLIYSTKGRTMEGKIAPLEYDMTYRYIELPLVYTAYFKGHLGGKKEFKYSLGIGPNISYWLGGKGTIESTDTHEFANGDVVVPVKIVFSRAPQSAEQHEVVIEKPTRLQLGLNFTAGFLFEPAPDRELVLTVRYELGHSYLSKESDGAFDTSLTTFQEPLKVRNQGFRVSLAYLIDLKVEGRKRGKSTNDPKKRRY